MDNLDQIDERLKISKARRQWKEGKPWKVLGEVARFELKWLKIEEKEKKTGRKQARPALPKCMAGYDKWWLSWLDEGIITKWLEENRGVI